MKGWPDFNKSGDLPPGIHQATLAEVIDHFGQGTPQRQIMARRLTRVYKLATQTGHLARFLIFGSFVTNKPDPGDIDIFLLIEDTFRSVNCQAKRLRYLTTSPHKIMKEPAFSGYGV